MSRPLEPLRVAIVNDYAPVVRGLVSALTSSELDIAVVGHHERASAHVILFDTFGTTASWDRLGDLLQLGRPVVVLSWERPTVSFLDLIEDGVVGHVLKDAGSTELARALRAVAAGEPRRHGTPAEQPWGSWPGQDEGLTAHKRR